MTTRELGCPYDHVQVNPDGCWEWLGYVDSNGYGHHGPKFAHRVYYELFTETQIPSGMHVDHLCRNRKCVNPEHLEPVTPRENILRGVGAGARNARKTHCDSGHEFSPENTRLVTLKNGETYRMCVPCNRATQRAIYARAKAAGKDPAARKSAYRARLKERAS